MILSLQWSWVLYLVGEPRFHKPRSATTYTHTHTHTHTHTQKRERERERELQEENGSRKVICEKGVIARIRVNVCGFQQFEITGHH